MARDRSPLHAAAVTILVAAAAAVAPPAGQAAVAQEPDSRDATFAAFAGELVETIVAGRASLGDKAAVPVAGTRVAVWPFPADRIPVPARLAEELNAALLAHLIVAGKERIRLVARDALAALIADMRDTGALDDADGAPIAALLKKARQIDVLVVGAMRPDGHDIVLSYQAAGTDGTLYGATRPRRIALESGELAGAPAALALDAAVRAAARFLADRAPGLAELHLGGIRYQDSGAQPPFARYLEERIAAALEEEAANVITGRRLVVRRAELADAEIEGMRGLDVAARDLRPRLPEGAFALSGTYWDFGDGLEVRLTLADDRARSATWTGRVAIASLGPVEFRPGGDPGRARRTDGLGPIAFSLTTPRGRDPAYRVGERLNLLVRADRDAWVYCFYRQSDGRTVQIFPNPHFWKVYRQPRLSGRRLHTVPGEDTFPFDFALGEPVGTELIKCFATIRDVTAELPDDLRGHSLDPLKDGSDARLAGAFRRLRGAGVSEASLVVTVTR